MPFKLTFVRGASNNAGELDPADGDTWDSLHPLSLRGFLTLGKPLPGLGIWRSKQRG